MRVSQVVAGVAALVAAASLGLSAQQAPGQAPASPEQPTFRAGITAVTTDVIARDKAGRFVSNLTKDDFTVLEDDVPQTITSFSLVHGGRTFNMLAPSREGGPVPEGIVLPAKRPVQDVAGRVVFIYIDDVHFEPELTPMVRKIVQDVFDNLLHDGDLVGLLSSGPSAIETGFTYDRKLAQGAISKIRGSGLNSQEIFRTLETSQGPADVRNRAQMAFYTAYSMLQDLEQVPNKRKVLLYISTGYDFDPFATGRNSGDRIMGGRFSEPTRFLQQGQQDNPYFALPAVTADIDLYAYMRELTLSANRANVSIYSVDPRALAGVVDAGTYLDQSEWRTYLQKTQSTLRYMAEETGGTALVNVNDFAGEFKKIDAETSDYYILGYTSSNADPMRRVRRIEVKTAKPDVTVSSRRAYSLKTPGTPPKPPVPKPTKKK
ncbi:MAG: VWA domain-containing protein [Vicinamibacterales bacterium]